MALTGTRKRFSFGPKRLSVTLLLILLVSVTIAWSSASSRAEEKAAPTAGAQPAAADSPEQVQRVREIVAQGTRHYEKAEFQEAMTCYDEAVKLNPQDEKVKGALNDTRKNLEIQKQLRSAAPADRAELEKALEARYAKASGNFDAQKLDEARTEFYQIWLLGGEYKQTRQYLTSIGQINSKKLTIEQARANLAPAVQVASAQGDAAPAAVDVSSPAKALIATPAPDAAKATDKKEEAKPADAVKPVAEPTQEAPKAAAKKDAPKAAEKKEEVKKEETKPAPAKEEAKPAEAVKPAQETPKVAAKKDAPKAAEKKEEVKKEEAKPAPAKEEAKPAEAAKPAVEPDKDLAPKSLAPAKEDAPQAAEKKEEVKKEATNPVPAPEPAIRDADKKVETVKAAVAEAPKASGAEKRAEQAVTDAMQLADAGKFDEALAMLKTAQVVDAQNPKVQEAFKKVEAKRDQVLAERVERGKKAAKTVEAAPVVTPKSAEVDAAAADRQKVLDEKINTFLDTAKDALNKKDFDAAKKNYDMALELDANNAAAQRGLEKLAGQKAKAEKAQAADTERVQHVTEAERQAQLRVQMDREMGNLFKQASEAEARKDYFSALEAYEIALQNDPSSLQAKNGLSRMQTAVKAQLAAIAAPAQTDRDPNLAAPEMSRPVQKLMLQADGFYREKKGDSVAKARECWQEVIKIDSSNKIAQTYLDQTAEEYEVYLAAQKKKEEGQKREVAGVKKINTPVTIDTTDPKVEPPFLPDFLLTLSYSTGINFNVTAGQENTVHCKFVDTPLDEVLDAVLKPMGLRWERVQGDVVQVSADMKSKVFKLTTDEARKVQILIADGSLNNIIREGKEAVKGTQLDLDEREQVLMMVDSQTNIDKMAAFLKEMRSDQSVMMATRIYKLDPDRAERVKALVDALILAETTKTGDKQLDLDRMVILDNSKENLIVKDTIPNLEKVEELLANVGEYIGKSEDEDLSVQTYEIKKGGVALNPESNVDRQFFKQTYEQIETLLYTEIGREKSAELGRRMWPERDKLDDVTEFKIVISDTKKRLRDVTDFLALANATGNQEDAFEIIYLKFQKTSDMQSLLDTVYGLSTGGGDNAMNGQSSQQGTEKRFTLNNPEREVTFRDCSIRLIRVEGSSSSGSSGGGSSTTNRSDRRAELAVRTALRADTQQVNVEEYMSETVDNYEIICEEIKIGGGKAGGRVRIRVRYTPPEMMGLGGGAGMYGGGLQGGMMPGMMGGGVLGGGGMMPGMMGQQGATGMLQQGGARNTGGESGGTMQELGFEYNQFGNLNALIVHYTDPAALAKLKDFILKLDKPTPQVSIETKFVTVNEEKAKEVSMTWNALDSNSPANLTPTATAAAGTAAAGTAAAGKSLTTFVTDPVAGLSSVATAGGTRNNYMDIISNDYTIISGAKKSFFDKYLDYNLHLLEVEGVVSYVNGPRVTVMDGQTADFEIQELGVDFNQSNQQYDLNTLNQLQNGTTTAATNTNATSGTTTGSSSTNTANTGSGSVNYGWQDTVMLSVEPEITSPESILLQIDVEIRDSTTAPIGSGLWNSNPMAGYNRKTTIGLPAPRKSLQTYARVKDGGTTVLGGWTGEVSEDLESGTPGLRDLPWIGKLLFSRNVHTKIHTNLLIFLSANLIE